MNIIKKMVIWGLTVEARLVLRRHRPFVVAVTGSVGKTATKDAIYDVLTAAPWHHKEREIRLIRKSQKSLNSEIGLPLTILGLNNAWSSPLGWLRNLWLGACFVFKRADYPDCLVLEVGADHPGDIRRVTRWLKPDVSVITRISRTPVHVEFFDSPAQVLAEKSFLAQAVKADGALVVYADDAEYLQILKDTVKEKPTVRVYPFGFTAGATMRAQNIQIAYDEARHPTGETFELCVSGEIHPSGLKGTLGSVAIYPLLAAAAVALSCGLEPTAYLPALANYQAPRGRLNIIHGINNSTILDDTYNASPDATLAALETLRSLETTGRKIAVLGDMMELGKYSAEAHRQVGTIAAGVVQQLITVGPRAKLVAEAALAQGLPAAAIQSFDSSNEAAPVVAAMVAAGDIILVKGSQSPRLERVSKALLAEPARAAELLVRQEPEWLQKA